MAPDSTEPKQGLTAHVADFVTRTTFADIPDDVIELGKKSILDGLGLALAGAVARTGRIVCDHLDSLGCTGPCTVDRKSVV